jgi:hypothetical protein
MSEKVTPFPLPPGQRFSFLAGGRTYVFIIPPFVLPAGYRVVKDSVLGGLHHEYRMVKEAA